MGGAPLNISVGLMENRDKVAIELNGPFIDGGGKTYPAGRRHFTSEVELKPVEAAGIFK